MRYECVELLRTSEFGGWQVTAYNRTSDRSDEVTLIRSHPVVVTLDPGECVLLLTRLLAVKLLLIFVQFCRLITDSLREICPLALQASDVCLARLYLSLLALNDRKALRAIDVASELVKPIVFTRLLLSNLCKLAVKTFDFALNTLDRSLGAVARHDAILALNRVIRR